MSRPARATREHTADEIALFAAYRSQRASCRPTACQGGEGCWVELGPPALGHGKSTSSCKKCGGLPRLLRIAANRAYSRKGEP